MLTKEAEMASTRDTRRSGPASGKRTGARRATVAAAPGTPSPSAGAPTRTRRAGDGAGGSARSSRRNHRPAAGQGSLLDPEAGSDGVGDTGAPETPPLGFRGPQVCSLVGITYRQLDYWARTGLLCPSVTEAHGSGTKRGYSYRDLVQLKVIKQLLDAGVSLRSARRAIEVLRSSLGDDLGSANLVINGSSSVLARTQGEVVDLLAGGQGVFNIIPLSGVVEELDADIVQMGGGASAASRAGGQSAGRHPGGATRHADRRRAVAAPVPAVSGGPG